MARTRLALGVVLLSAVLASFLPANQSLAIPYEAKWFTVNIPQGGDEGRWVLAEGSDVRYLILAPDGTLYCYANPTGTDYTLFKSADGGYSWSHVGKVKDNIVGIAVAPDDANFIAYATSSRVYLSRDGGESFVQPPVPGGAGSGNIEITSLAVGRRGGFLFIAAGTRDTGILQYGGVYVLDESKPFLWANTAVGNYDVYKVAFSSGYAGDGQLLAVVTDEVDTFVTSRVGDGGWGQLIGNARLDSDNSGVPSPVVVGTSADIAFPDGYNAFTQEATFFVALDAGAEKGDVYRIRSAMAPANSVATDLNIGSAYGLRNVDVTSMAVTGSGTTARLMSGAAGSAQVYQSMDAGKTWSAGTKPPTGASKTYVVVPPDFNSQKEAYAATSGAGSAVSHTTDGNVTWNQIGLIDTRIDSIVELAPSPGFGKDNTLFMLTFGGKHSLWRSTDSGAKWERILSGVTPGVSSIDKVALSPQYGAGSQVVFLAGQSGANPVFWKSTDGGQSFGSPLNSRDPSGGAAAPIDVWVVVNDSALFVGSYDGSSGLVYRSDSSGLFYATTAAAGSQTLNSMALSPAFAQDKSVLAGSTYGRVYLSRDNGVSFSMLGPQLPDLIVGGSTSHTVTVAFDTDYNRNRTVYAASHCKKGATNASAIYRFIIGTSTAWESIGSMPVGAIIDSLMVSGGTLYTIDSRAGGGLQRSLDPTHPLGPSFVAATGGLDSTATLSGLWLKDNRLWSADTTGKKLVSFADSLTVPANAAFPANSMTGIDITGARLGWEVLKGATSYEWQLDYNTDFSDVPAGFTGTSKGSSVTLPALQYATRYFWRVRALEPVPGPWSGKQSFVTRLGSPGNVVLAPELKFPGAGAAGVSPKPVFQWTAVDGAEKYELLVSADVAFSRPLIVKAGDYALPVTAWQCDVNLDYDTTFYWKVRAIGLGTASNWSAAGAFTIGALAQPPKQPEATLPPESLYMSKAMPPLPPPLPPPQPVIQPATTPQPSPQPQPPLQAATPDWVVGLIRLGTAFVVVMLAILVTMVLLLVKVLRS